MTHTAAAQASLSRIDLCYTVSIRPIRQRRENALLLTDYLMIIMALLAAMRYYDPRSYAVWACCAIYALIRIYQIRKKKK